MSLRLTPDEFDAIRARFHASAEAYARGNKGADPTPVIAPPVRHKFHARATVDDGIRFDSKAEAAYYARLKLRQAAGEVVFFLRQVPFHLPGGTKYVCDFLEFRADGTVHAVDVKGVETPVFKVKRREVEAVYPIQIEVTK